jgi:hypothetical protein
MYLYSFHQLSYYSLNEVGLKMNKRKCKHKRLRSLWITDSTGGKMRWISIDKKYCLDCGKMIKHLEEKE